MLLARNFSNGKHWLPVFERPLTSKIKQTLALWTLGTVLIKIACLVTKAWIHRSDENDQKSPKDVILEDAWKVTDWCFHVVSMLPPGAKKKLGGGFKYFFMFTPT